MFTWFPKCLWLSFQASSNFFLGYQRANHRNPLLKILFFQRQAKLLYRFFSVLGKRNFIKDPSSSKIKATIKREASRVVLTRYYFKRLLNWKIEITINYFSANKSSNYPWKCEVDGLPSSLAVKCVWEVGAAVPGPSKDSFTGCLSNMETSFWLS